VRWLIIGFLFFLKVANCPIFISFSLGGNVPTLDAVGDCGSLFIFSLIFRCYEND